LDLIPSFIRFKKGEAGQDFWLVEVAASNGLYAGVADARLYPDEFKYFIARLYHFPREPGDEIVLSSGGDDDAWYSYLYLRLSEHPQGDGALLEVRLRRNSPELKAGGAVFYLPASFAEINALGQTLQNWWDSAATTCEFSFQKTE
jgi:hypothetical protein